ncbi:MAG: ribonuclease P protein component [Actinomycetota bacterium]|nr:ribonuclease P protein component [Actinomycetota bacterium]
MRRGGLTRSEIKRTLSSGKRLVGGRVVLFVTPVPGEVRAAFVAGRRVGMAVQRNRARRVLREAWRRIAPSVRAGTGVVVVARKDFLPARTQELETEMRQSLAAAGLLEA